MVRLRRLIACAARRLQGLLPSGRSQEHSPCAAMDSHNEALLFDEEYFRAAARFDARAAARMSSRIEAAGTPTTPIQIPVVVHIVASGTEVQATDEDVECQIRILNDCFAATYATGVPAKWSATIGTVPITFLLATEDPDGNPVTSIVRKSIGKTTTFTKDKQARQVKKKSRAWRTDRFLNIWVCNFEATGHATFPWESGTNYDGIVIHRTAFGRQGVYPSHLGRTLAHEAGHWLGLIHIWGDDKRFLGDDRVADTVCAPAAHSRLPSRHCRCSQADPHHMFMNFMDYMPDDVKCFFTKEQAGRMVAALENERRALWSWHPKV